MMRPRLLLALLCACSADPSARSSSAGEVGSAPPATSSASAPTTPPSQGAPSLLARAGSRYVFRGEFRGATIETGLELRATRVGGDEVLYFFDSSSRAEMVAPVFGMGALTIRADGLYTADVLMAQDIAKLPRERFRLLVAIPAKVGAGAEVESPAVNFVPVKKESYKVAAIERVVVPAGTFEDCVRLAVVTEFDGAPERSTVWLAPEVGPVKLSRATGRVDELVSFSLGALSGPGAEARRLVASGALLLDVRTAAEFDARHLEGATNIPADEVDGRLDELLELSDRDAGRPIVVYAATGARSRQVKALLEVAGWKQVFDLGAMSNW